MSNESSLVELAEQEAGALVDQNEKSLMGVQSAELAISPEAIQRAMLGRVAFVKARAQLMKIALALDTDNQVPNVQIIDMEGEPYFPGDVVARMATNVGISLSCLVRADGDIVHHRRDIGNGHYVITVPIRIHAPLWGIDPPRFTFGQSGSGKSMWAGHEDSWANNIHKLAEPILRVQRLSKDDKTGRRSINPKFKEAFNQALADYENGTNDKFRSVIENLEPDVKKQAERNGYVRAWVAIFGKMPVEEFEAFGYSLDKCKNHVGFSRSTGGSSGASAARSGVKVPCPGCGTGHMVARKGSKGDFYGCSRYKQGCRQTMEVAEFDAEAAKLQKPSAPAKPEKPSPPPTSEGISKELADDLLGRVAAASITDKDLKAYLAELGVEKLSQLSAKMYRDTVEWAYLQVIDGNPTMDRDEADAEMQRRFNKKHPADLSADAFSQQAKWVHDTAL